MKIITCCFNMKEEYRHLYKMFEYSVQKHMPNAEIVCMTEAGEHFSKDIVDKSLSIKLQLWNEAVQAETDDNLILCDTDMIFLDDISNVFEQDFDIAYTKRIHKSVPINTGIIFVKNNDKSREFFKQWYDLNNYLLANPSELEAARAVCTGTNQPAFAKLIDGYTGCKLLPLECSEYNSCEMEWNSINRNIKVLHLKETLRKAIKGNAERYKQKYKKASELYNEYFQEMRALGLIDESDIIQAINFQEGRMVNVRFKRNGYETQYREEIADIYFRRGLIEYVDKKPVEVKPVKAKEIIPEVETDYFPEYEPDPIKIDVIKPRSRGRSKRA